jgi:hypothetical protein
MFISNMQYKTHTCQRLVIALYDPNKNNSTYLLIGVDAPFGCVQGGLDSHRLMVNGSHQLWHMYITVNVRFILLVPVEFPEGQLESAHPTPETAPVEQHPHIHPLHGVHPLLAPVARVLGQGSSLVPATTVRVPVTGAPVVIDVH